MSDPVTNVEIEDVLASIRRLVSAEDRAESRAVAETDRPKPRKVDRLVLTPALRVPDATADADDAPNLSEPDLSELDLAEPGPSEDTSARHGDMPTDAQADAADETGPQDAPDRPVAESPPEAEARTGTGDAARAAPPWKDPETRLFDAVRTAAPDDAEADATPSGDEAESDAADEPAGDDLGARIAALEKVVARSDEHYEPDTPGSDDYAGTEVETLNWEPVDDAADDDAETVAEVVADVVADAPEDTPEDAPDLLAEAPVMDEAALRELIADIVREELQGALGERITRNVRKLVRREIHRAMTIQDLE